MNLARFRKFYNSLENMIIHISFFFFRKTRDSLIKITRHNFSLFSREVELNGECRNSIEYIEARYSILLANVSY